MLSFALCAGYCAHRTAQPMLAAQEAPRVTVSRARSVVVEAILPAVEGNNWARIVCP